MQGAARAVGAHDAGLHGVAVVHLRHVPQVHGGAVHHLDRQVVHLVQDAGAAVELDLVVLIADLGVARRQDEVLIAQGVGDIGRRKLLGVHRFGVEIHHHLAELAAVGQGHGGALNGGQRGADEVLAQVEQFLFAERLAGQAQLQDGHARRHRI